ncbi:ion channel CASTOR-like isoform X3 [Durio zibethinus]|uniref:Ion channel CASTOR-like isoform X3 n=1 Tax=Durio zibethinus TaxID=66656 RepID=A0A6P5XZV4_DURZI|nr:ion channel CASTOR-like isoform X3 [Durio zibethinus]
MSLDSESSPSSSRDWFFPSPSFIHSTSHHSRSANYPRKFTTIPRHSPPSDWKKPHKTPTFRSVSSSSSASYGDPNYGRLRRRVDFTLRSQRTSKHEEEVAVLEQKRGVSNAVSVEKTASGEMGIRIAGQRFKIRWQMAFSIAVLITAFGSLVHKNFSLHNQVIDLQGSLLNQLAIANESLGGGIVVVMAERDKEEMELDIAKMEFDFRGTSVICRSGSPLIVADLKKVSVSKARAIIVLAEDGNADQSDARALRTVLSLTGVKEGLRGHIVVELSDLDNEVLVKLVGGELVETVVAHDVIGRLMIQCARQPGLAQIWEDILGFENCEFYIKRWPQLDGMQFEDVLISFPDAVPCGVKVASRGGKIILNPDDSYALQEGDEVLVIAEDDDTYAPGALPMVRRGNLPGDFIVPKSTEKILLCGWRRDMEDIIMVLDAFLAPGSELWMFNDVLENEREKKLIDGGLDINRLTNITLVNREGNAVIRRHLESLPLESFDSILILADESVEDSAIQADSRSLATLLLIRDIQAKRLPYREAMVTRGHRGSFSQGSWIGEMQQASDRSVIISEILDPRTKNLLSMSKISDYVLSNELVSMALAMVAEDRQINDVLEELFAEEGNELHIQQADLYLHEGEELSFYEIILRARQRREIVIGYRLANAERAVINPPAKSERRRWSEKDVFVVITEKE